MMNAKNRVILSGLLLFLLCAAVLFHFASKNSARNPAITQMKEIQVLAKTDPMDPVALSPDGILVAHAGTGFGPTPVYDGKTIDVREVSSSRQVASFQVLGTETTASSSAPAASTRDARAITQLQFCNQGSYLLAIDRAEHIHVFDTRTNQLRTTIDLNPLEYPPPAEIMALRQSKHNIDYNGRSGGLHFVACAANGPVAAFFIDYDMGLGGIKIFNLDTGAPLPGSEGIPMLDSVEGIAVSPLGTSIAIIREVHDAQFEPGGYFDHAVILIDSKTERVIRTIRLVAGDNHNTSPISFAGESTVAVQLLPSKPGPCAVSGPFCLGQGASVHFFDVGTGADVQTIADPQADDFFLWGMSADGRTMLAYTGRSYICTSCNKGTGQKKIEDARFTLWNRQTGKPIAQSPSLTIVHHECPWYRFTIGSCTSFDETPVLAMSQSGNAVIASFTSGGEPVKVYPLQMN